MSDHQADDEAPSTPPLAAGAKAGAIEMIKETVKVAAGSAALLATGNPTAAILAPLGAAFGLAFFESLINRDMRELERALHAEQLRELADVAPRLEQNLAALQAKGTPASDSDVTSFFMQWSHVWLQADPNLRRILKHAFAAAFDPKMYEEGVAFTFFRLIEREGLSYGDLRLLAISIRDERVNLPALPLSEEGFSADIAKATIPMIEHHADQLVRTKLAVMGGMATARTDGFPRMQRIIPTKLGKRLCELVSEAKLAEDLQQLQDE